MRLQRSCRKPAARLASWPQRLPRMADVVIDLLRSKGAQLKSTLLTSLASHVAEDPFAKVKVLIERLLKEANAEANQKGWCDKATKDATQKKDYAAQQVEELNGEMATLEALRDKLTEELSVLDEEIG